MNLVLDHLTLYLQQRFENDIFARYARTQEDVNKFPWHAAYRLFILWIYGRLHTEYMRVTCAIMLC